MVSFRIPLLLGAVALTTGCASTGFRFDAASLPVVPVQSMQPAGTAAGHYALGRIDMAAGRLDAAVQRFEQALQLDPDMVDAYNALGIAHGLAGRYERAVTVFDAALLLAPESSFITGNLGYAMLRAGRLDDASRWLERARELEPGNERVQENLRLLARAQHDGGRRDEAPVVESTPVARQNEIVVQQAGPYELVTASSNDGALLRVGPNVYEVRGSLALAASGGTGVRPPATDAIAPALASTATHRIGTPAASASALTASALRRAPEAAVEASPTVAASGARTDRADPSERGAASPPAGGITRVSIRAQPVFQSSIPGLEISNGVGKPHLAGGTARSYARFGWRAVRVSDYRYFGIASTEIHYLEGHREDALALRATLPVPARLVLASTLHTGVSVRLVLGEDMVGRQVAVAHAVVSSAAPVSGDSFAGAMPAAQRG
jgi:tetratricopeptide (TPR) repeat protein